MMIDARIRVHFLDDLPQAGCADQLLVLAAEAGVQASEARSSGGWAAVIQLPEALAGTPRAAGHRAGCICCTPRPPQAEMLARMFQSRARGEMAFFRGVAVCLPPPQSESLRLILVSDPFVSGCFVIAG